MNRFFILLINVLLLVMMSQASTAHRHHHEWDSDELQHELQMVDADDWDIDDSETVDSEMEREVEKLGHARQSQELPAKAAALKAMVDKLNAVLPKLTDEEKKNLKKPFEELSEYNAVGPLFTVQTILKSLFGKKTIQKADATALWSDLSGYVRDHIVPNMQPVELVKYRSAQRVSKKQLTPDEGQRIAKGLNPLNTRAPLLQQITQVNKVLTALASSTPSDGLTAYVKDMKTLLFQFHRKATKSN